MYVKITLFGIILLLFFWGVLGGLIEDRGFDKIEVSSNWYNPIGRNEVIL